MKKLRLLVMSLLLVVGGQAMAQTRGAMFLSAAFPMKDYAEFDGFDEFALMSNDNDDAGAGIGFDVGLKWYFNVGTPGLGVMLSVDGIYNGPNADLKAAYREATGSTGTDWLSGSFSYKSTPRFINVPIMLGLNYIYHFNPNLGIYVEAGAGGNMAFTTTMESTGKLNILGIETQQTTTQKYDMGFAFAYQAGIGLEVAKNLVIGCSFYDLGKTQAKGEQVIKSKNTITTNTTTEKNYLTLGTVHPYMIMARIGFSF